MPFPDSVRNEALKRAHFMCVACHAPFVEVHHITPQSEGGPDTLDNAAPLCPGCHGIYGANPVYRKQIRQMRDNWYDVCEKRFGASSLDVPEQVNAMFETLQTVRADQVKYQDTLDQIKSAIIGSLAGTASVVSGAETVEEIRGATGPPGSGVFMPPGRTGFCPRCNRLSFDDDIHPGNCTICGTPLTRPNPTYAWNGKHPYVRAVVTP
jgi:ribosomal protein L37E